MKVLAAPGGRPLLCLVGIRRFRGCCVDVFGVPLFCTPQQSGAQESAEALLRFLCNPRMGPVRGQLGGRGLEPTPLNPSSSAAGQASPPCSSPSEGLRTFCSLSWNNTLPYRVLSIFICRFQGHRLCKTYSTVLF